MKYYLLALGTILVSLITAACSGNSKITISPTATLAPGTSQVTGVLQVRMNGAVQPVKNEFLYLAATIKDSAGKDSLASMDRLHSPKTETDDQGHFVFSDVPPGKYGLVLDVIMNSYLLMKPGTQEALLIELPAGQRVDLGTLVYDTLPTP